MGRGWGGDGKGMGREGTGGGAEAGKKREGRHAIGELTLASIVRRMTPSFSSSESKWNAPPAVPFG